LLLDWLELTSFRCYESLRFEASPGVNVLVGDNGAGKTTVLEAIGYLGLLRSFRGAADEALIAVGSEGAVVRGEFATVSGPARVEAEIPAGGRRRILFNGKRPKRNRDVLAQVPIVAFQPDDLDLVKRGPGLRRHYLDDLAAQLRPQAVADQQEFERALRQRNTLLRREGRNADRETLDVWDTRVSETGARVFLQRSRVLTDLDPHLGEAYRIVGGSGNLTWDYTSNWGATPNDPLPLVTEHLFDAISARRERDLDQRATTAGPHRDDPALLLDGRPARSKASQGEQRTAALALRIGSLRVIAQQLHVQPLLLLDDVFSELDQQRAKGVLGVLDEGQVFVTTARDDDIPVEGTRWRVQGGAVS
jgi:DNA replication and repair protein RecF